MTLESVDFRRPLLWNTKGKQQKVIGQVDVWYEYVYRPSRGMGVGMLVEPACYLPVCSCQQLRAAASTGLSAAVVQMSVLESVVAASNTHVPSYRFHIHSIRFRALLLRARGLTSGRPIAWCLWSNPYSTVVRHAPKVSGDEAHWIEIKIAGRN